MDGKLPLLAGYLCLLLFFSVVPWNAATAAGLGRFARWHLPVLVLATAAVAWVATPRLGTGWQWSALPILSATVFLATMRSKASTAAALTIFCSCICALLILWWVPSIDLPRRQINISLLVWSGFALALGLPGLLAPGKVVHAVIVVLLVAASWALMRYGGFETRSQWLVAWHHWGAYWGPVETIKAGLIPFHDVPIQYGAGPTALLSLIPVKKGFDGMQHIVALMSLVGVAVVVDFCLLAVHPLKSAFASLAAGCAGAVACMLWIASPNDVSSAMTTPSTFALRFVPAFVLLWLLVRFPARHKIAFAAWAVCTLWSVEAAFYAFVIYWPSRLAVDAYQTPQQAAAQVLRVAVQALAAVLVLVGLWWLAYFTAFGVPPSPRLYVLYALFPPGAMPVNWAGPIVWLLFVFCVAGCALQSSRIAAADKRIIRLSALCLAACASYYLGRSHDNNIINLMPPAVMLLCVLVGNGREAPLAAYAARASLAATLAMLPFFGYASWKGMRPATKNAWSHQMSFLQGALYPSELVEAIKYVRENRNEYFEIIDEGPLNFQAYGVPGVWNGLHPLSNYPFVPSADRVKILQAGAARFKRPGWLIVQDSRITDPVIADFKRVYRATEERRFGPFLATRLVPSE
ncbi:hypothetical protein [Variovorax terrae]|uniref:Uncharacterized protein n=1 Tax=Variovorax terrae TaxID=2923278 RepID=A0A9X1VS09_9BURK|nr:hypothetical protein [Variovorax terrae]MCJ0761865.1 hypothetical protein [Variovorax terrae]